VTEISEDVLVAAAGGGEGGLWSALVAAALPSVRLAGTGACDPWYKGTRLGGVPVVGGGFVWPRTNDDRPLCMVGQLNSDEVNAAFGRDVLPAASLLGFFYEAEEQRGWGFDPHDAQYWRVVAADAATAIPARVPDGAWTFPAIALAPRRVLTVPEQWEPPIHDLWDADRDGVNQTYGQIGIESEPPRHRVFGWPDLVQNPMQLECQLASNGIYVGRPEGYRDPRVDELRAGAADWLLLWQIDTDDEAGWMWGDVGTIYYWIRRQDLAAADFNRIWMVFQCC
jgi:uncharacterized protein YwqG